MRTVVRKIHPFRAHATTSWNDQYRTGSAADVLASRVRLQNMGGHDRISAVKAEHDHARSGIRRELKNGFCSRSKASLEAHPAAEL